MTTFANKTVEISEALTQAGMRGEIISRGDARYEEARALYNAMTDKHPAVIARCVDTADAIAGVKAARETGTDLAIRGGGHNGAGLGSVDDGLVLDLSAMRGVRVDPEAGTVTVQGGCTWGDVDHATHPFGGAVPSGFISTTGVGGLTLGGGIGYLSREHGLTIDNLLAADVVLADGTMVVASEDSHPDLFWALRGGGGNFGVVTSFTFRMAPVRDVICGPTLWSLDQAPEVLAWYREFILSAPRELNGWFAFLTVPPVDPFPASLHLEKVCAIVWCYTGDPEGFDEVFEPVRATIPPILDGIHPAPFPALQSTFDALYPAGLQWYWRSDFVAEIPDEAIEAHLEHARALPTMHSTMHLYPIDGAVQEVGADETAFAHRDANWAQVIVGVDPDPANAGVIRQWCVDYFDALHPYSTGGTYVNFLGEGEGGDRIRSTFRDNFDRLARVKATYDPDNLFHVNQNIPPS